MTILWQRLKFAVATDIDAILDKKEGKNPISLLNKYIQEAERETETAGNWLERQTSLSNKLEKELQEAESLLEKRQAQAELAQAAGESDLTAFAEQEVAAYSSRVDELRKTLDENTAESVALEQRYEEMKHKVKDMKVRQLQLMGKENATRAHYQMDKILSPELVAERIGSFDDMASYVKSLGDKVEERHEGSTMEILLLLAHGYTNQEIADELYIAVKTVKSHVSNLLAKLEVHDRTQAVIYAFQHKLVAPPE